MEWRVDVKDAMHRQRQVIVNDTLGVISVTTPPGEGFHLDPDGGDYLAVVLQAASARIRRGDAGQFATPS